MKTSYSRILLVLVIFFGFQWAAHAQVSFSEINDKLLKKSMKEVLGSYQKQEWSARSLAGLNKEELNLKQSRNLPDSLYFGTVETDKGERWIVPEIAPSKSEVFSFVMYLDKNLEIVDVDVLEYRESYGYEIDYSFFREQFHGKSKPEGVRFGRSIQNISGATISARSITYAVHDLLSIINKINITK